MLAHARERSGVKPIVIQPQAVGGRDRHQDGVGGRRSEHAVFQHQAHGGPGIDAVTGVLPEHRMAHGNIGCLDQIEPGAAAMRHAADQLVAARVAQEVERPAGGPAHFHAVQHHVHRVGEGHAPHHVAHGHVAQHDVRSTGTEVESQRAWHPAAGLEETPAGIQVRAAGDDDGVRRGTGKGPRQHDGIRGRIDARVDVDPVARPQLREFFQQGVQVPHGCARGRPRVGVVALGRTVHVAVLGIVVDVEGERAVAIGEIRGRLAAGRRHDVFQFHPQQRLARGRVVRYRHLIEIMSVRRRHVRGDGFPSLAVVARKPDRDERAGLLLAGRPTDPRPGLRVQRAAVAITGQLDPGVGPGFAGLRGAAEKPGIQASAVGRRLVGHRGRRIAEIDGGRIVRVRRHERRQVGGPAAGGAAQMEIAVGRIGEQRVGIHAVRPAPAQVLQRRERRDVRFGRDVPNDVVAGRENLVAQHPRAVAQDAVGDRERVGARLDQGGPAPQDAVHPPVGPEIGAVQVRAQRLQRVAQRHALLEPMSIRAARQHHAVLVAREPDVAQDDVRRAAAEAAVAVRQLEVFQRPGKYAGQFQGVRRRAAAAQFRPVRTADDPHRPALRAGIERRGERGDVGGIIPRIHVDDVAAFQVVGVQNSLQAALGRVRSDAEVGIVAEPLAVDVVRGTAVVDVERERCVGGGPHAERLGVGRGESRGRIPHPPLDGRMAETRNPDVEFVGRRHGGDRVRRGPLVGGILQRHVRAGQVGAGHPFEATSLQQAAAIVVRHGVGPFACPALAGLCGSGVNAHVYPAAVGGRFGPNRHSGRSEIDRRAVGRRRIHHPCAVGNESCRALDMEIQPVRVHEQGVGERVAGPVRVDFGEVRQAFDVVALHFFGIVENVSRAGGRDPTQGRSAHDDVADHVRHAEIARKRLCRRRIKHAVFEIVVFAGIEIGGGRSPEQAIAKGVAVCVRHRTQAVQAVRHGLDADETAVGGPVHVQSRRAAGGLQIPQIQVRPPHGKQIAAAGEDRAAGREIGAALEPDQIARSPRHGVADDDRRIGARIDVDDVARIERHGADQVAESRLRRGGRQAVVGIDPQRRRSPHVAGIGTVVDIIIGCADRRHGRQRQTQSETHLQQPRFHMLDPRIRRTGESQAHKHTGVI